MSTMGAFVRLQADIMLAQQERVAGLAAKSMLRRADLPRGEGRPVLLLPGFGANEAMLKQLNILLTHCGYESETFVPGFPKNESLHEFIDELSLSLSLKVKELNQRTGKKVSLVGQSAGGIYSREFVMRNYAEGIDRVITLGSPTIYPENLHLQNKALNTLVERRFGTSAEQTFGDGRFVHWEKHSPQVPYVAIYSPIDGAVKPQTVIIPESQLNISSNGAIRENIAVLSSHFGMVLNPLVMLAVADRLGTDPESWQAFDSKLYLPQVLGRLSSLAYPTVNHSDYEIPAMDLHPGQPRGRDVKERVIQTLKTEHGNISGLLSTLLSELGSSAKSASGVPNYAVVAGILDYLHDYTDGFHHPREDLLFERLRKREPDLDQVIGTLIKEHQWIEAEGRALTQALQQRLDGKRADRRNKSLDAQCRRYVKKLASHLQTEESEVFRHTGSLHNSDWVAVDKGLPYEPDPLFGQEIQQRYQELADALVGRVEGISVAVTLNEVIWFEAIASGLDTLGSGLAGLRKQRQDQTRARRDAQRELLEQTMKEHSPRALIKFPFKLATQSRAMRKSDTKISYDATKELAVDVWKSMRQGQGTA